MKIRKSKWAVCTALILGMALCSATMAATYNVDTLIGAADLGNSGNQTEMNELAALLGTDSSGVTLVDKNNAPTAELVNDMGIDKWVIDISPDSPGFYALKFGTGGTGATANTFYFENVADLGNLVFTDTQVDGLTAGCGNKCNIGRLSHYTALNALPLPAAAWLFGSALLGLVVVARRKATVETPYPA